MKFNYAFSNLFGTVYKQGSVIFTPDGNCLLSPVGNRISHFDLINNKSFTFPFQNGKNIEHIVLSPNGALLLSIDEDGRALLANVSRRTVLHRISFKSKVTAVEFSPCGRFIAVALKRKNLIQVWRTPLHGLSAAVLPTDADKDEGMARDFSPFILHRTYAGHYDAVTSVVWSKDGQWFLTTSKDMTIRLYTREPLENYKPVTLAGHRDAVIGAWFSDDGESVYSVSRDGACFTWTKSIVNDSPAVATAATTGHISFVPGHNRFESSARNYFNQKGPHGPARVKSAQFHRASNLLVVGFSNGVFGIYEMPDFNNIHTLSISQNKIDAVSISPSGEWLAFASSKLGQLLVWEWQSETYILKQQGHFYDMNCLCYSPDGQLIATGGDDGKVKIWNTTNGFCFVTFGEHTAGVTAIEFAGKQGGKQSVVFTASLDGTVRAYDLIRYRNFRTFTSPHPVQFSSLAVDPSGEVVCAASQDTFEIFVWSVQTGMLLDVLSGHEGPISSLAISPDGTSDSTLLASGSWDKNVRVWDLFSRGTGSKCLETFQHKSDVLAVAFRPDGKEICSSTLDGTLTFWDPFKGGHSSRVAQIEGRRDIAGGRRAGDARTAANSAADKYFTSLCYTADGLCVLAGGNSKWVCLYDVPSQVLLKKYEQSHNMSLDGVLEKLNSKNMTDAGPANLIDDEDEEPSDVEERLARHDILPGAKRGDMSTRTVRPEVRTKAVRFSPTGRSWSSATTEGLMIFSLDDTLVFDPFDLDMDLTPNTIVALVEKTKRSPGGNDGWLKALVMSLRLNEPTVIQYVYEQIPVDEVEFVARSLPVMYLDKILRVIAVLLDVSLSASSADNKASATAASKQNFQKSPHVEFHLTFLAHLFRCHGRYMRDNLRSHVAVLSSGELAASSLAVILRAVKKSLSTLREDLSKVCNDNLYTLRFLAEHATELPEKHLNAIKTAKAEKLVE